MLDLYQGRLDLLVLMEWCSVRSKNVWSEDFHA